jgi:hypothetical protein
VYVHPVTGLQPFVVQGFRSLQVIALPRQVPSSQRSLSVQASASLHDVPEIGGSLQMPVDGSQVPDAWHWSRGVQLAESPWQAPSMHRPAPVHRDPASQGELSGLGGSLHSPEVRLQTPAK